MTIAEERSSTHFGHVVLLRELESDAEAAEERRNEGAAMRERAQPQRDLPVAQLPVQRGPRVGDGEQRAISRAAGRHEAVRTPPAKAKRGRREGEPAGGADAARWQRGKVQGEGGNPNPKLHQHSRAALMRGQRVAPNGRHCCGETARRRCTAECRYCPQCQCCPVRRGNSTVPPFIVRTVSKLTARLIQGAPPDASKVEE